VFDFWKHTFIADIFRKTICGKSDVLERHNMEIATFLERHNCGNSDVFRKRN